MKIKTGLLFLLVGALIWLPAASSSGAQTAGDSPQTARADVSIADPAPGQTEGSKSNFMSSPGVTLHSGARNGTIALAKAAVRFMEGPFFTLSPAADIVLAFNHQFKKKVPVKWEAENGEWALAKNKAGEDDFLASSGESDESATISYDEHFNNFIFTVRMARKSSLNGQSNRIIVRARGSVHSDGHYSNEYSFNITRGGDYSVFKNVDGESREVVPWTHSDAIKRGGKWNELRVKAQGSSLFFYVNGQLLEPGEIIDGSLEGGKVGIGFYRHPDSRDDQLLVDWAILRKFVYSSSQQPESLEGEQIELIGAAAGVGGAPDESF